MGVMNINGRSRFLCSLNWKESCSFGGRTKGVDVRSCNVKKILTSILCMRGLVLVQF